MTVETELYSRLSGFAGLSSLVGSRIYPGRAPQNTTTPYLTFFRVSATRVSAMGSDPGNAAARYQFDVWSDTHISARQAGDQVRLALQRWRNSTGTVVEDTFIESDRDLFEDDTETFRVSVDAIIHYLE